MIIIQNILNSENKLIFHINFKYEKMSNETDRSSLFRIGRKYERNKDIKQALEYYIKAANLGHTFSQF